MAIIYVNSKDTYMNIRRVIVGHIMHNNDFNLRAFMLQSAFIRMLNLWPILPPCDCIQTTMCTLICKFFFLCRRNSMRCANKNCNSIETMNHKILFRTLFAFSNFLFVPGDNFAFFRLANYSLNIEICSLSFVAWVRYENRLDFSLVLLRRVHPVRWKKMV